MQFYISRFKNIEKKEFECEVVTPMFLSGADKKTAELRAASIKGLLRFWWRAIHGSDNLSVIGYSGSDFPMSPAIGSNRSG